MASLTLAQAREQAREAQRTLKALEVEAARAKAAVKPNAKRTFGGVAADNAGPGRYYAGANKGRRTIAHGGPGEAGIRGGYFAGLQPIEPGAQPIGNPAPRGFIPGRDGYCALCAVEITGHETAADTVHALRDSDAIAKACAEWAPILALATCVHTPHWLRVPEVADVLGCSPRTDRWTAVHVACRDSAEAEYRTRAAAGEFGDDERIRVEGFALKARARGAKAAAKASRPAPLPPVKARPSLAPMLAPPVAAPVADADALLREERAENARLKAMLAAQSAAPIASPTRGANPPAKARKLAPVAGGLAGLGAIVTGSAE